MFISYLTSNQFIVVEHYNLGYNFVKSFLTKNAIHLRFSVLFRAFFL
jgi:uncharacterized protein YjaZ